jgi:hypothetical protein
VRRGTVPSSRLCAPILKSSALLSCNREPAAPGGDDELDAGRLEQRQPGRVTRPDAFDRC